MRPFSPALPPAHRPTVYGGLPTPPDGESLLVDDLGNYIIDDLGNYLTAE